MHFADARAAKTVDLDGGKSGDCADASMEGEAFLSFHSQSETGKLLAELEMNG